MVDDDDKDREIARLNNDMAEMRRKLRAAESRAAQMEAAEGQHEAALTAAKAEGAKEARAQLTAEHAAALAAAEVRVRATGRLADADDALAFIDTAGVVKDGKADPAAIDAALDDLLTKKPHLARPNTAPPPPAPPAGGRGTGGTGNGHRPPPGSGDQGPRPFTTTDPDAAINDALRQAAKR